MIFFKSPRPASSSQSGNAFFMVLLAVSLFAALSYAISQQRDSGANLSKERTRLLASDVLDMGNKYSDAISQLRLRRVSNTKISFDNTIVVGYTNATCTDDTCKVFAFDGGGKNWETPAPEISGGEEWGFTGDLAIENIGTTDADLVAVLPKLSLAICNRINMLIGLYGVTGAPPSFSGVVANKFTGTYAVIPIPLSDSLIQAQKSACVEMAAPSGTAFSGSLPDPTYVYYHVLDAR